MKASRDPGTTGGGCTHDLPDPRGFGASDKPGEKTAYADSAMARDVLALIEYLGLHAADVMGFSMGAGTAARLLVLRHLK